MARISAQQIRQMMLIADSNLDPNFPPEKLAVFDEQGNLLDLSDIALRLRLSVLSNWRGEWTSGQAYDEGSLVRYNSSLYLATNNVAADSVAPDAPGDTLWAFLAGGAGGAGGGGLYEAWKGDWSEEDAYAQGDVVRFGGTFYMAAIDIEPAAVVPDEADASIWIFLWSGGGGGGGGTDSNAMHYRGPWFNNVPYSFGDVVLDGGSLYVLSADSVPAFATAPSAEDPETANWSEIASLSGGSGGNTLLKSYIHTAELVSDGSAHPTVSGFYRLPTPDRVDFNFAERTLVRINASFEVRNLNTQNALVNLQLENPSFALAQNVGFNVYNNLTPEFRRLRISASSTGLSWALGLRANISSGAGADPYPEAGLSMSYVCEPGPNSIELIYQAPGGLEVRKRLIAVEVIGAL